MATVIGVVSSIITIFSFLAENFNNDGGSSTETKMRVVAALDGTNGLSNAGGGRYDPGYVSNGNAYDINIQQSTGQQPTYALFTGNTDAICIAYIAATWPDGQKYGWVGSWGRRCNHPWYYSGIVIGGKYPDCIWLDSNGDPTPVTAFQVHFPEFNDKGNGYNSNTQYYCDNAPPFNTYTHNDPNYIVYWSRKRNTLEYATSPAAVVPVRKARKVRSSVRGLLDDTRLVKSSIGTHSASDICNSETSAGPDFLSLVEGKFCDMKTRQLWDVCDAEKGVLSECFNVEINAIRLPSNARGGNPAVYSTVIEWGQ